MRGEFRKIVSFAALIVFVQYDTFAQSGDNPPPQTSDFSIARVPLLSSPVCSPIFFCRTGLSDSPTASGDEIGWCMRYATEILKRRTDPSELLLVQIGASVGVSRLKEIAGELNKLALCSGSWPPGQPKLVSSERSTQGVQGAGILGGSSVGEASERGVVLLKPKLDTSPESAAQQGPDYSQSDFVASVADIPDESQCSCSEESPAEPLQ